jgi:hypothetical protein
MLRRPREEKRSAQSPLASGFFLVGEEKWIELKNVQFFAPVGNFIAFFP